MNISQYLNESRIEIGAELYSKDEALERLIRLQKDSGAIHNAKALKREIAEREKDGNSALSCRIAIPCTMHTGAKSTSISAVTVKNGVEYNAPDKRPVKILFMIAGKSGSREHLQVKKRLQKLLSDPSFTARLCAADSKKDFLAMIESKEKIRSSQQTPVNRRVPKGQLPVFKRQKSASGILSRVRKRVKP